MCNGVRTVGRMKRSPPCMQTCMQTLLFICPLLLLQCTLHRKIGQSTFLTTVLHTQRSLNPHAPGKNEANRLAVDQNYVCGRLEDDREADFASRTSRFVTVVHTFTFGPCRWPCSLSRMPAYTARARAWADKERRYIHSLVCQCIAAERVTPQEKNVHTHLCTYTRRRMQEYVDMHKTRAERIVQGS